MIRQSGMAGFLRATALLVFAMALLPSIGVAQNADDGFDPNANGSVHVQVVQANGKILVGGTFTNIDGQARNRIARLDANGNLDTEFSSTDVDGIVSAIAVQADGRIVIGGGFSQVGASLRNRVATFLRSSCSPMAG